MEKNGQLKVFLNDNSKEWEECMKTLFQKHGELDLTERVNRSCDIVFEKDMKNVLCLMKRKGNRP